MIHNEVGEQPIKFTRGEVHGFGVTTAHSASMTLTYYYIDEPEVRNNFHEDEALANRFLTR